MLVVDSAAGMARHGTSYRLAIPADRLTWAVVSRAVNFGLGAETGNTLEVLVVGTPTQYSPMARLEVALSTP